MTRVLAAIEEDGARAFRVFPRESGVLLAFAERVATDVVSRQSCRLWSGYTDVFRIRRAYTLQPFPLTPHPIVFAWSSIIRLV